MLEKVSRRVYLVSPPPTHTHTPLSTKNNIDATSSSHSGYVKVILKAITIPLLYTFVSIVHIYTYNMIAYIASEQAALFRLWEPLSILKLSNQRCIPG